MWWWCLCLSLVVSHSDGRRWGSAVLVTVVEISLDFWWQPQLKSPHSLFQQVTLTNQLVQHFQRVLEIKLLRAVGGHAGISFASRHRRPFSVGRLELAILTGATAGTITSWWLDFAWDEIWRGSAVARAEIRFLFSCCIMTTGGCYVTPHTTGWRTAAHICVLLVQFGWLSPSWCYSREEVVVRGGGSNLLNTLIC